MDLGDLEHNTHDGLHIAALAPAAGSLWSPAWPGCATGAAR
jgi:hypothetical protein